MAPRIAPGQAIEACDTETCNGPRLYQVGKLDHLLWVCTKCMEELVSLLGWRLLGFKNPPLLSGVDEADHDAA